MRIHNRDRIVFVVCLMVLSGCDHMPFLNQIGQKRTEQTQIQPLPNTRNSLLMKLKSQDSSDKLTILMGILRDEQDRILRRDALRYLSGMGHDAIPIADRLTDLLLEETDPTFVNELFEALDELDINVETHLLTAAQTADATQSLRIVKAMGVTQASSQDSIQFLLRQISSGDYQRVLTTCQALERIGSSAHGMLPALIAIVERSQLEMETRDENSKQLRERRDVLQAAVRAIHAIGPDESSVSALIKCLDEDPTIASVAAGSLAQIGPSAASALPALKNLRNRDDHGGRDIKTRTARDAAAKAISALMSFEN